MTKPSGLGLYRVFPQLRIVLGAALIAAAIGPQTSPVSANPGDLLWQDETEKGTIFDIAALDQQVFAAGRAGDVITSALLVRAYDAQNGDLLWQQRVKDETAAAVTVSGQHVIVSGRRQNVQTVRSFARRSGMLLWQDEVTGAQADGKIADVGGRVFIAGHVQNPVRQSLDLLVRAYDRETGALLWQDQVGGPGSGIQNEAWAWDVAAEGSRVFAVGFGLAFGIRPFLVRAYDAATGGLLWQDQAGDVGEARRVKVAEGRVFVVGFTDTVGRPREWVVRTYLARTGALLWEVRDNNGVEFSDLVVAGKRLFVGGLKANAGGNLDFLVRAYDAHRGDFIWEDRIAGLRQNFASRLATAGGLAVAAGLFRDAVGNPGWLIRAYDADTGAVIWQDQIANSAPSSLAIAGTRVFAGGSGDITFGIHGELQSDFLIRAYDTR